jgi:hypothetical protein
LIIDTSALIAILHAEPDASEMAHAIESARDRRISAANWLFEGNDFGHTDITPALPRPGQQPWLMSASLNRQGSLDPAWVYLRAKQLPDGLLATGDRSVTELCNIFKKAGAESSSGFPATPSPCPRASGTGWPQSQ